MLQLLKGEVPQLRVRYPHMMPEDAKIWTKFLIHGQFMPDHVFYDVHVGRGLEPPEGSPEWLRKYAKINYTKRIDVVGRSVGRWWVIECKPGASYWALGQVIFYSWAFGNEIRDDKEIIPVVITDVVDEDLRPLFDLAGVLVLEVGRGG